MSYRPLTDIWILARAKLKGGRKYYGAYLGGFPERARSLLGASITEPVLHVCGGLARLYPYKGGFGANDKTLDMDAGTAPDYQRDAREAIPTGFKAILCDPPYSEADAEHWPTGAATYPSPGKLVANCIEALPVGGRVGIIHYMLPKAPKNSKFIACVGVISGFNNRIRCFSVWERTS